MRPAKRQKKQTLGSLQQWLTAQACIKVSLVSTSWEGVVADAGIVADNDVAEGSVLLEVPKTSCLTWKASSSRHDCLRKVESRLPKPADIYGESQIRLAFALMYERSIGKKSFWYTYLSSVVPQCEKTVPFCWETPASLGGTEMLPKVLQQRARLKHEWESFVWPLVQEHPALFSASQFSYKDYTAACSAIISRCSPISKAFGAGLVPVLNEYNHGIPAHVELQDSSDKAKLELVAMRACVQGEEVYYAYGSPHLSAREMLCRYGFIDSQGGAVGTKQDCVFITSKHLTEGGSVAAATAGAHFSNRQVEFQALAPRLQVPELKQLLRSRDACVWDGDDWGTNNVSQATAQTPDDGDAWSNFNSPATPGSYPATFRKRLLLLTVVCNVTCRTRCGSTRLGWSRG